MENRLLITKREHHMISAFLEDNRITQLQAEPLESESCLGNIYMGKVKNIVKNINSAFVEFEKGRMGYLSLEKEQNPIRPDTKRNDNRILIGDEILVQVVRDATKTKPPTLSCSFDFSGKYLVLKTGETGIRVSKKIGDKKERERLKGILEPFAADEYAWIVRTNSAGTEENDLLLELERLKERYKKIVQFGVHKAVYSRIYTGELPYLDQIKNLPGASMQRIETDIPGLYGEITEYIKENHWEDSYLVSLWDEEQGNFSCVYNIEKTLKKALHKKVWLKSGAYLVIEPTEALVSIDVNTGKSIGKKKDVQKHFLKINKEAAAEIAIQLRLRNLSGMILVDFIDLKEKEKQEELLWYFREELKKDPVPVQLIDMTKLGLVEITRMKTRKPLHEVLGQ